jgi:hypothetical protein
MAVNSSTTGASPLTTPRVWLSLLAGPIVWLTQTVANEWIISHACSRALILGLMAVALGVTAIGAFAGLSAVRPDHAHEPETHRTLQFVAFGGFLVSLVFVLIILWSGVTAAATPGCE